MGMKYNAYGWSFIYCYCANCLEMGRDIQRTNHRLGVALAAWKDINMMASSRTDHTVCCGWTSRHPSAADHIGKLQPARWPLLSLSG